ncbi:MAG: spore coat associated protein CotJA [Candidatus Pelethousia sp.]|nr:spore coat associated protein CotJA [Candidatus Pelethousia sp.]
MICNTNRCGCAYASMSIATASTSAAMPVASSETVTCGNTGVVVPAGEARTQPCDDFGIMQPRLAEIQFPIQQYESGFCPCEALETGTLFPELVS